MVALAALGEVTLFLIGVVPRAIFHGYALSVLWGWFVVPTFGAPDLAVVPAIGIGLMVGFLSRQLPRRKTQEEKEEEEQEENKVWKDFAYNMAMTILWPSTILLAGWIVHLFM